MYLVAHRDSLVDTDDFEAAKARAKQFADASGKALGVFRIELVTLVHPEPLPAQRKQG
jgi:hypothetical protein